MEFIQAFVELPGLDVKAAAQAFSRKIINTSTLVFEQRTNQ
jgi:hypothetical protein